MNDELSKYTFDEIEIGFTKQFQITITETMLDDFTKLSGDFNPLHTDSGYAISSGFSGRVCSGMLLGSFFSRLIGMYLPGKHALHFSQSLKFVNPCIINEKIIVKGEILDKSAASKIITIKTTIINESKKIVVDGIACVRVRGN
tara:strand:+ start:64 stop:495 length:432 start_codon:yes stop_codon:yes gene_type:complete